MQGPETSQRCSREPGCSCAAGCGELRRVAAGDHGAIEQLYDRYAGIVLGVAVRMTGDRSVAEDVVQETFLGVWRNAARFDPERGSARTWLMAMAHHRTVDALRRRRAVLSLPDEDLEPGRLPVAPDPWAEVATRLEHDEIASALASLPAVQRRAIELAYYSGRTQVEIAAITRAPLGTVKSRVRLGLLNLRDLLDSAPALGDEVAARPPAAASAGPLLHL